MANVKTVFYGTENTEDHELTCFMNINKEIYIGIDMINIPESFITLDKPTAIKLAKVLRSEINKISTDEQL
jgi:hypothetical protein